MPAITIPAALELAIRHHEAGRLADAEVIYRQILAVQPNHAEAHHLLGVIAQQCGRYDAAVESIGRAIQLGLGTAAVHSNLGEAYRKLGRRDEAIAAYRRAVQINPALAAAHFNLGSAFMEKGEVDEAAAAFRRAVASKPGYAEAHANLGVCLAERGQLVEAVAEYRWALSLSPDLPEAHFNLGVALSRTGENEAAIAEYRRATELRPDYAEAYHNLGAALLDQGQLTAAEAVFRQALAIKPDYAEVHYNLGNALREQGRPDEAAAAYRRAIELEPEYPEPHRNLGHTHRSQGRLDEAVAAFRGAAEHPWADAAIQSNLILTLHYVPGLEERVIQEERARWNRRFGDPAKQFVRPQTNDRDPERRLRIGYVSADFRDHTLGRNLMPLFRRHDHQNFEIICYAGVAHPDPLTEEFRSRADRWRSTVGVADAAMSEMIRQDAVDILVDLALHTSRNRLPVFARQLAPVQVSFAGYPGSTGLEAIGYRISDRWLEAGASEIADRRSQIGSAPSSHLRTPIFDLPPAERVYLLDSFWCYDPCGLELPVNGLPAKEHGRITFGSLNNFSKVNEPVLKLWGRLLKKVAHARLLLLCPAGSHRERVSEIFAREGVNEDRVEFVEPRPRREYMELYHRVDVMLDAFPYGGHTTSLDALWMGVPVVTFAARQIVSRAGFSQLSNLRLPELVAFSEDEYVNIAAELAGDLPRLAELRATLRSRMEASVLMDGERFTRGVESAYRAMWREWCASGTIE